MKICLKKLLDWDITQFTLFWAFWFEVNYYHLLIDYWWTTYLSGWWYFVQPEGFLQGEIKFLRIEIVLNFFIYLCFC